MSKYPKLTVTWIITVHTVQFKPSQKPNSTQWYKNKLKICINILHITVIKMLFLTRLHKKVLYIICYEVCFQFVAHIHLSCWWTQNFIKVFTSFTLPLASTFQIYKTEEGRKKREMQYCQVILPFISTSIPPYWAETDEERSIPYRYTSYEQAIPHKYSVHRWVLTGCASVASEEVLYRCWGQAS